MVIWNVHHDEIAGECQLIARQVPVPELAQLPVSVLWIMLVPPGHRDLELT
jgi:hypothetical protein